MPPRPPYLIRRGNVFNFRIAVSADLRELFQCREYEFSFRIAVDILTSHTHTLMKLAIFEHEGSILNFSKQGLGCS